MANTRYTFQRYQFRHHPIHRPLLLLVLFAFLSDLIWEAKKKVKPNGRCTHNYMSNVQNAVFKQPRRFPNVNKWTKLTLFLNFVANFLGIPFIAAFESGLNGIFTNILREFEFSTVESNSLASTELLLLLVDGFSSVGIWQDGIWSAKLSVVAKYWSLTAKYDVVFKIFMRNFLKIYSNRSNDKSRIFLFTFAPWYNLHWIVI